LNGLLTPIMTYGLLPLIESTFDITTDFSLLELSNLNHPLLKRLSVQAPGTYHHSIIVGNLAEAAAQAVNANSLLARVGSYYHDVGKMEKAEYFVENQISKENPHRKLVPRMSALILMNHVKRGLEIAEKYKLPSSIKEIIVQHQGTTLMSFFYQKALEKNGSEKVSEEDYRYPGPKPQAKEAAIVMLADAVEAATRSLKEPTHSRLKGLIEDLVDGRFQEGELDESPLTLKDLGRIKESFLTILAGTFHARVEYPEKEEPVAAAKLVK
jgi:putative nucleotidyltransferase with HDIG domain